MLATYLIFWFLFCFFQQRKDLHQGKKGGGRGGKQEERGSNTEDAKVVLSPGKECLLLFDSNYVHLLFLMPSQEAKSVSARATTRQAESPGVGVDREEDHSF